MLVQKLIGAAIFVVGLTAPVHPTLVTSANNYGIYPAHCERLSLQVTSASAQTRPQCTDPCTCYASYLSTCQTSGFRCLCNVEIPGKRQSVTGDDKPTVR
jgi:hypothetical protein